MSSAANNPALTGVSDPNPQMISGGTPAQPPPTAMGAQQLPPPSGTSVPMPTGKGGGPSIPTTPLPPPMGPFDPMMGSARTAGDVRLPNTAGAHMAQGYDIAQGLADTLNRVGQGEGQMMPPKRQDIRTGPRSKYPSGALTRPPAVPMRDPTMPSPSTGYSIPFGKRRRGLV